ncbi:MAG: 4Fe-4S binding protein [Methanobacteriaceae archaeon]
MIVVNQEDCIKCGACEGTCPSSAIEVTDKVVYCDLCDETPKCVDACPKGALGIENMDIDEDNNVARIIFNPSKCDQCGDCVEVCPPKTLKVCDCEGPLPLTGFCVMCQKCVNICPVEVIGVKGIKEPKKRDIQLSGPIDIIDCKGCGMCVPECPVNAIDLDVYGGEITIDEGICVKCGVCSQTCPWDAVFISAKRADKRKKNIKTFEVNDETCIGCNSCVEICPGDFIDVKPNLGVDIPDVCPSCGLCANICPVDAITLDVELGDAKPSNSDGIVYNAEKCDFVGACAQICPSEAIRVVTKTGMDVATKEKTDAEPSFNMCTRCGACTSACPEGALSLTPIDKVIDGKIVTRNRIQFNPSKCNQCGDCLDVCPYQMLKLKDEGVLPLVGFCTLCEQCVGACPKDALEFK